MPLEWGTDENCRILEQPCTAEETGDSPSRGTSRKMGSSYAVLNRIRVSLQPFLLSACPCFSKGFWTETDDFSPCVDVLLSKGFQMWTHFRKILHQCYCFSGEHPKRGNLICSKLAQWIRKYCSAPGVHCMVTTSLLEPATGLCSRSHHGPGLWAVQLFWLLII